MKVGDTTDLVCSAPQDYTVKNCAFENLDTKEKIPLYEGANFQNGRILNHKVTDRDCGMTITNVMEEDNGRWECNLAAQNNIDKSSNTGSGIVDLTVAGKLLKILLNRFRDFSVII